MFMQYHTVISPPPSFCSLSSLNVILYVNLLQPLGLVFSAMKMEAVFFSSMSQASAEKPYHSWNSSLLYPTDTQLYIAEEEKTW